MWYRNTETGQKIETTGAVTGESWELVRKEKPPKKDAAAKQKKEESGK